LTLINIDMAAVNLTKAINGAYAGSARRTLGRNTGQPWWNDDCKSAVQRNKAEFTTESAWNLRNTVRKAKAKYWAGKLDSVKDIKDVFKMTKWHQSTGSFRSPPLTDPQAPTRAPAESIEQKRALLVKELLTNTAKAGDIVFNTLVVALKSIPFPETTLEDIRKSILQAGNIAPKVDEILTRVL
jgi:hypothetical protein